MVHPPSPRRAVRCSLCGVAAPDADAASRDRRLSWGWSTWQINDRGHNRTLIYCPRHTQQLRSEAATIQGRLHGERRAP